jgi:hypothetical protein
MHAVELPVTLILPPPETKRGEGVHLSGIIRCIATEQGILKPEWAEDLSLSDVREITDPVAILRINIGLAWEKHYIPMLGDVVDHPGEMRLDGIYMTHDGESVSVIVTDIHQPLALICHEVKATYKSTKTVCNPLIVDTGKALESNWMWMAQLKGYCKSLNTRYAMLHVLFLCGDYSFPIKPVLRRWLIEFEQEELDMNWQLMVDYMNYRLACDEEAGRAI